MCWSERRWLVYIPSFSVQAALKHRSVGAKVGKGDCVSTGSLPAAGSVLCVVNSQQKWKKKKKKEWDDSLFSYFHNPLWKNQCV